MKLKIRAFTAFLCVLLTLLLPTRAMAAGTIDLTKDCSLTIIYQVDSVPMTGARFDIYLVAVPSASGGYEMTGAFRTLAVDLDDMTAEKMLAIAGTLDAYVNLFNFTPTASGTINEGGFLTFTGLEPGLYLVRGHSYQRDGYTYTTTPFLIYLPTYDEAGNRWGYDMSVNPKYTAKPDGGNEPVERRVLKIWNDSGSEADRPKEITVYLLRNGAIYDTVILNRENQWRYSWTNLDPGFVWTVAEAVPSGYTVSISQEGITFVITNSKPPVPPPPPPPPPPELPQTGQLWWPVPCLVIAGMFLFLVGYIRSRGADDEA